MSTTYLNSYAVTSFNTHSEMIRFLHGCTLQILDIDHRRQYIAWKF